jgi:hypothetical protein
MTLKEMNTKYYQKGIIWISSKPQLNLHYTPDNDITIGVSAEGYPEGKDSFTVNTDASQITFDAIDLELFGWIIYIVIGGILMVRVAVFMFLKKSKATLEEDWECEEEI